MPELYFLIGYIIYVTSMDQKEPFHIHITKKRKIKFNNSQSAKIWLGKFGEVKLAHNNEHIPDRILKRIMLIIKENKEIYDDIVKNYCDFFNILPEQVNYYKDIDKNITKKPKGIKR